MKIHIEVYTFFQYSNAKIYIHLSGVNQQYVVIVYETKVKFQRLTVN